MAVDGRLVEFALLAESLEAMVLGSLSLGETLESAPGLRCRDQLSPSHSRLCLCLLEVPSRKREPPAQFGKYALLMLNPANDHSDLVIPCPAAKRIEKRVVPALCAVEIGSAPIDLSLSRGEPALRLLFFPASEVKCGLKRELELCHVATVGWMMVRSVA